MVTRYDFINVKATVSKEGWIRDRPIITRSGIFNYQTKDGKIRREYRPEDEVFNPGSLATVSGIPVTNSHVGIVSATNPKGIIGTVISPGMREDSNVVAEIIIHDAKQLGDRRELSLGYTCDLDETPGQTDKGERYDAVQKNITYNHLAIVRNGRAGNARLRLDSDDAVNGHFAQEDNDMDPKLVTIRYDNIDYVASPEIANRLTKQETDLVDLKKRFDTMEAERDTFKAAVEDEKKKAADISKSAFGLAKERIKLEDFAAKLSIKFDSSASDRDIKIDVVNKLRDGAIKFDGKSDDYVNSAFDIVTAEQEAKDKGIGDQRKLLHDRKDEKDTQPDQSSRSARERMIARLRGETKKQEAA